MKMVKRYLFFILIAAVFATVVLYNFGSVAQGGSISGSLGVVIYPSKDQSPSQQNGDEGECYAWAKQQTGIDPVAVASTPTHQEGPAVGGGERVKGAAVGAVGGLAIGAIAGDAGEGAGIGAVVGGMAGGHKARQNKKAKEQQAEQAKAATIQHFNKAFGACLEARGYVVK